MYIYHAIEAKRCIIGSVVVAQRAVTAHGFRETLDASIHQQRYQRRIEKLRNEDFDGNRLFRVAFCVAFLKACKGAEQHLEQHVYYRHRYGRPHKDRVFPHYRRELRRAQR